MESTVRVLVLIGLVLLAPRSARADETIDVAASVTKVDANQQRATIDSGKRAGLKVGDYGALYGVRSMEGSKDQIVDFDVRIARGKVVEVTDDAAVVTLDAIGGTVEVGAYFLYNLVVSDAHANSPLFRVAAQGIGLHANGSSALYFDVERLLADSSQALQDKTLDVMVADIKAMRDIAAGYTARIQDGRYHGKTLVEAMDGLDRAQIVELLVFLDGYPGRYAGFRFTGAELWVQWVINGTTSGEPKRLRRRAKPMIATAEAASAAGKLDDARKAWHAVLKTIPDHEDAILAVKRIDSVFLLQRHLAMDRDDTGRRYELMETLYNVGAYSLALAEYPTLLKAKFDPWKLETRRAYTLSKLGRWREAEESLRRALRDKPDDKGVAGWHAFARAKARLAKTPNDAAALMELAAVHVADKSWDAALSVYREILIAPKATAKQRETAARGQKRISLQQDLDLRVRWAHADVRSHSIDEARNKLEQAVRIADQLQDKAQVAKYFGEVAETARWNSETELAIEILQKQTKLVPDNQRAHSELAYALLDAERFDEADASARTALSLKGDSTNIATLTRAFVARAKDDAAGAESLARKALQPGYAWPLLEIARAEAAKSNWEEAIEHARKALALNDGFEMQSTHAAVMRGQQASEALQANPSSARERLRLVRALAELALTKRVAEEIAKLPADGTWRSDGWWALVETPDLRILLRDRLTAARNAKPATEYRKRKLAFYEAQDKLRSNLKDDTTRFALAKMYLQAADFGRAIITVRPLFPQTDKRPEIGDLVRDARQSIALRDEIDLAQAATAREDWPTADRITRTMIAHWDRIGAFEARLRIRGVRAEMLRAQGRYPEALAIAEENKAIADAYGEPGWIGTERRRRATLRSDVGTLDVLFKELTALLKECEDRDDDLCVFASNIHLASYKTDDGQLAEGIEHARKAWQMAERMGRPDWARNARFELADGNLGSRRVNDAEHIAIPLLADARKHGDIENEQLSLMVLGAVAMQRGQGKSARTRFQEVYELGTRTGNTGFRANARRFEGMTWLNVERDFARASTALEQSAALYATLGDGWATERRGVVLRALADTFMQADKLKDARKTVEEALVLAKRFQRSSGLAWGHAILALINVKENKPEDALAAAKEALRFAKLTDDSTLTAYAWHSLARGHAIKQQDNEAFEAYEKALEFLGKAMLAVGGDTERGGLMNTGKVRDIYKDAVAHFLKLGKNSRAMEVLELSRDAQLKQSFDPTAVSSKDAKVRAKLDKYQKTRARVNGLEKQLDQALNKPAAQRNAAQVKALGEQVAKTRAELKEVALDLKVTHRHLYRALAVDPDTLMDRRGDLPKDSVLVEYFVADDALFAFVISAALTQPAVVRIKVTSAELAKIVVAFRVALIAENEKIKQRDDVEALGRKLEDWLIEPLRTHLAGASTVIILPFGPLYYVPFDALVVSDANTPVRYAIEDYRFSIQTATTLEYLLKAARPRGTGTLLAVSDPDGSLPGATREVNQIIKTHPDARVLNRKDGTVKNFSALVGGYRYIHLATHGLLDADPRKSFLQLADGQLTVRDIAKLEGLDQSNELVVLSACESATEQGESAGDELVSLAVSFAMAGAPALVASLWEVADDSTSELMATFYRALEANAGDRLDALRNAKLNLLRFKKGNATPYAAPWHWSSFQLYGDFRAPVAR